MSFKTKYVNVCTESLFQISLMLMFIHSFSTLMIDSKIKNEMTKRFFLIIRKCSKKLFDDVHMYIAEYYSLSFHVQRFKLFELLFKYNFLLSNQSRGLTPAPPQKNNLFNDYTIVLFLIFKFTNWRFWNCYWNWV